MIVRVKVDSYFDTITNSYKIGRVPFSHSTGCIWVGCNIRYVMEDICVTPMARKFSLSRFSSIESVAVQYVILPMSCQINFTLLTA